MFMPKLCVVLPAADRAQMTSIVAHGNTLQKLAVRARILLMLADRVRPSQVARRLALSRNHVHYRIRRYVAQGVTAVMRDASRPGRKKRITPEEIAAIVNATQTTTPPGRTHWSTRTMARAHGVSEKTIRNIWHQHGLQPHRVTRFKLSKDPHFVDKLRDVVGLYLNPPEKAVVFCVDEKSGIQALDRTRPVFPCGRACRNGKRTTTSATGRPACMPRCGCSTASSSARAGPSETRSNSCAFSTTSRRRPRRTRRFTSSSTI